MFFDNCEYRKKANIRRIIIAYPALGVNRVTKKKKKCLNERKKAPIAKKITAKFKKGIAKFKKILYNIV